MAAKKAPRNGVKITQHKILPCNSNEYNSVVFQLQIYPCCAPVGPAERPQKSSSSQDRPPSLTLQSRLGKSFK